MKPILTLIFCLSLLSIVQGRKCHALAIEGGGPTDAYSVGVLNAIWKYLPKEERSYESVTGVSLGGFNAYVMSKFAPGEEQAAAEKLTEFWSSLKDSMVSKSWTYGYIEGLFFKQGLYDTSPLLETLTKFSAQFSSEFYRKLTVPMAELNSGSISLAEESVGDERLLKYILASTSTPGWFPPIVEGEKTYVDASTLISVDVTAAIERCREIVDKDEDIIIDAIMVQPLKDLSKDCSNNNGIQMLLRYFEINNYVLATHHLEDILEHFPKVNKRYIFHPKTDLPTSLIPVSFSRSDIAKMLVQGESEGKETIEKASGTVSEWKEALETMKANLQP